MRPSLDEYFINIANVVATRGTCCRRNVGCVLINNHNHIIATGYNGTADGLTNCTTKATCSQEAAASKTGDGRVLC